MQKLILIEDVEGLGRRGSIVRVKNGYAFNHLLPKRLAVTANADNMRRLEKLRERFEKEEAERIERARSLVDRLEGLSLTIAAKASEEGHLYGSVSVATLVEQLEARQIQVEPRQVKLAEPIKHVGAYTVPIQLHETVKAEIKVFVVEEAAEDGGSSAPDSEAHGGVAATTESESA